MLKCPNGYKQDPPKSGICVNKETGVKLDGVINNVKKIVKKTIKKPSPSSLKTIKSIEKPQQFESYIIHPVDKLFNEDEIYEPLNINYSNLNDVGNMFLNLKIKSKITSSKQYIKLCDYFLFFYKKVNEFNNDVNNNSLSIDEFINKYKISFKKETNFTKDFSNFYYKQTVRGIVFQNMMSIFLNNIYENIIQLSYIKDFCLIYSFFYINLLKNIILPDYLNYVDKHILLALKYIHTDCCEFYINNISDTIVKDANKKLFIGYYKSILIKIMFKYNELIEAKLFDLNYMLTLYDIYPEILDIEKDFIKKLDKNRKKILMSYTYDSNNINEYIQYEAAIKPIIDNFNEKLFYENNDEFIIDNKKLDDVFRKFPNMYKILKTNYVNKFFTSVKKKFITEFLSKTYMVDSLFDIIKPLSHEIIVYKGFLNGFNGLKIKSKTYLFNYFLTTNLDVNIAENTLKNGKNKAVDYNKLIRIIIPAGTNVIPCIGLSSINTLTYTEKNIENIKKSQEYDIDLLENISLDKKLEHYFNSYIDTNNIIYSKFEIILNRNCKLVEITDESSKYRTFKYEEFDPIQDNYIYQDDNLYALLNNKHIYASPSQKSINDYLLNETDNNKKNNNKKKIEQLYNEIKEINNNSEFKEDQSYVNNILNYISK